MANSPKKWKGLKLIFVFALQLSLILSGDSQRVAQKTYKPQNDSEQEKRRVRWIDVMELGKDELNSTKHKSSLVYIMANSDVSNDDCWQNPFGSKNCGAGYGITSLSLIVPRENIHLVSTFQTSPMTNETLGNLYKENGSFIHSIILSINITGQVCSLGNCQADRLSDYLTARRKHKTPVKIGVEYEEYYLDCCKIDRNLYRLEFLDLTVLRIQMSPLKDVMSYGMFSQKLNALVQKNKNYVNNFNSRCALYIRLVCLRPAKVSDQVNIRFCAILSDYVRAWKDEHNATQIFIESPVPQNTFVTDNNEYVRTSVTPTIRTRLSYHWHGEFKFWKLQDIPSTFHSIHIKFEEHYQPAWVSSTLYAISAQINANISITLCFTLHSVDWVKLLAELANKHNIHTIYFIQEEYSRNTTLFREMLKTLQAKNIKIGCYGWKNPPRHEQRSLYGATALIRRNENCQRFLPEATSMIYYDRPFSTSNIPDLIDYLWDVESERQTISKAFPGIEQVFFLRVEDFNVIKPPLIYCDPDKRSDNEHYNGIITFANMVGWPRLHQQDLISDDHNALWKIIKIHPEIRKADAEHAPIFVRTNEAKPVGKDLYFPYTYPCAEHTKAPPDRIQFVRNNYTGTTVPMDLKQPASLKVEELETLLRFAFSKFPTVELVIKSEQDMSTVTNVMTRSFLEYVRRENNMSAESRLVYLELPFHLASDILKYHQMLPGNVGVHFSGWENYLQKTNLNSLADRQVGITIENCTYELHDNLTRMTSLPFFHLVKYVVCTGNLMTQDNSRQSSMDEYLNTMFYIKTYMERYLPEVEVTFRLIYPQEKESCREELKAGRMLRFLNDVQQHSKAYKIRYFLVNAFEEQGAQDDCSQTWWRIGNYNDLSNTSVYTDIEDDHFRRPTVLRLQKPQVQTEKENKEKGVVVLVVVISVLSFLLGLCALAFWLYHRQTRKKIVTQKEILAFYNGNSDKLEDEQQEDKWMGMGFPKNFRIQKNRIELGRLVGSGEFGEVFIGLLDKQTDVAVKVPRQNASAQTFKSVLSEVKILHYLGIG